VAGDDFVIGVVVIVRVSDGSRECEGVEVR
jgi:hypothetical protein